MLSGTKLNESIDTLSILEVNMRQSIQHLDGWNKALNMFVLMHDLGWKSNTLRSYYLWVHLYFLKFCGPKLGQ